MFGKGILPERGLGINNLRVKHFNIYRELHRIAGNFYRWTKGVDTSPHWRIQKNYVLFQRFLPDNEFDTRITVIGDRAFGFRRMTRKSDFRASGSGIIDYDIGKIDLRCVDIAFRVSQQLGFQSMAIYASHQRFQSQLGCLLRRSPALLKFVGSFVCAGR